MKLEARVLLGLVLSVLVSASVLSLGLSHEHLEDRTLKLKPGQNYYFKLNVQNEEDREILANLTLESDIAELVGGNLLRIPPKTFDKFVYFNITVPDNAEPGKTYNLRYIVVPIIESDGGQVPFSVKYDRNINVVVDDDGKQGSPPRDLGEVAQEESNTDLATILLILVIAVLVLLIAKKYLAKPGKKKSKKKGKGK